MSAEQIAESIVRRWLAEPSWTRDDSPPGWHGVHDAIRDAILSEREACAKVADDINAELQSDIALTQMHGAFPILSNGPRILELQKRCVEQVAAAIRAKPGEHGR